MGNEHIPVGGFANTTGAVAKILSEPNFARADGYWTSEAILREFIARHWIQRAARKVFKTRITSALGNLSTRGHGAVSMGRDGRYVLYRASLKTKPNPGYAEMNKAFADMDKAEQDRLAERIAEGKPNLGNEYLTERLAEIKAKQPEEVPTAEPVVGDLFEVIAIVGNKVLLRREGSDAAWEAKVLR